jgi:GNAT superfamily N-acetyltransferase
MFVSLPTFTILLLTPLCLAQPPPARDRPDANHVHVAAYRQSVQTARVNFFDTKFGKAQLGLVQLATDPDYMRNGAGTKQVRYGQERAESEGLAVTVLAGPRAEKLYKGLGFEELGIVTVQAMGEDEVIKFPALAWKPSDWAERGSG